ncbi:S1 RNA-binding domain-containing protein [Patescibacteria group bacterium]|nr:S1 RNA-binding domain-containing protein [Patescibacteria group bacterium]
MKTLLEQNNSFRPPKVGEVIKGKIIQKGRASLFLDLGNFKMGIIYGREFQEARDTLKNLKIGDEFLAKITELENEDGYVELSIKKASDDLAWETLREKKEKRENIAVKVLGLNKGGLLAKIFSLPAFLPFSQLSPEHYSNVKGQEIIKIVRELQKLIGKDLTVKIFALDYKNKSVILSEKLGKTETVNALLKNYKKGDIVEGEITGLTDFGAFIKFPASPKTASRGGGQENLSGLISSLELDDSENLEIGKKTKAKIINISNNKVYLSLKALKEVPANSTPLG